MPKTKPRPTGNKTNHPSRGKLIEFKCPQCGADIEDYAGRRRGELVFCSPAHSAAYYHAQRGHGGKQTVECAWCGAEKQVYASQVRDLNFCSRDHYQTWLKVGRVSLHETKVKRKPAKAAG